METLPGEMIEHIMCSENLSITDVVNFSLTNRYNNVFVTNCNMIWKKKYFKTWPQFVELFENKFNYDWYAEVRYIYDLKRRTREILSMMSSRFFKINTALSNSNFTEWFELYYEKPQTYYYLIDDLINIVNTDVPIQSIETVPITTPGNKTLQYYAMKVLTYLRRLHLAKEWKTFIALPQKLQTLEKGIIFFGLWSQPDSVWWQKIGEELDELTEEVKKNLKLAHPNHPLFDVPKEQLEMWRNENIECDKYSVSNCMQIKHAMADKLKYQLKRSHLINNIFSKVELLKEMIGCAVHVIFMIIYEAIGRRLGVKFEPVVVTRELYMRSLKSNNPEEHEYIDFYHCYYRRVPMQHQTANFAVATTQQVINLIAKQVAGIPSNPLRNRTAVERLCSRFEFLELVSAFDVIIKHDLARVYMNYNVDTTSYIEALIQQKNQAPDQIEPIISMLQQYQTGWNHADRLFRKVQPKARPTNLKYAVGMVMKCAVSYDYNPLLCIICDWDCTTLDEEPLYKVLLSHGSYLYVKQGKLITLTRIRLSWELLTWCFKDIGRHFSHRFETVFVPNAAKEIEYPADSAVRNAYNELIKPRG